MTRGIGIASISLLFSVAALAADLPAAKAPPPPPPPVFSWQGPYLGIYAGALLGDGNFTLLSSTPLRGEAFIGGGTGGYNWQWDEHLVFGLEADFGYRGPLQVARVNFVSPSSTYGGVLGTARARVGYAFAPRWLAYATGGFIFGTNFTPRRFDSILPLTFGEVSTGPTVRPGWTGGVGVEYAWSDRISVKAEYLYAGLAKLRRQLRDDDRGAARQCSKRRSRRARRAELSLLIRRTARAAAPTARAAARGDEMIFDFREKTRKSNSE